MAQAEFRLFVLYPLSSVNKSELNLLKSTFSDSHTPLSEIARRESASKIKAQIVKPHNSCCLTHFVCVLQFLLRKKKKNVSTDDVSRLPWPSDNKSHWLWRSPDIFSRAILWSTWSGSALISCTMFRLYEVSCATAAPWDADNHQLCLCR